MVVKVCGMREPDNIRAVEQLGIDMMGFIFWLHSPRYVEMVPSRAGIIPDYSSLDDKAVHPSVARVGVFVDDMPQSIVTRVVNYQLDFVQLHGSESPVMIDNLRRTLDPDIRPGIRIIKALSIGSRDDVARYRAYEGHVDLFLFDNKCRTVGGSGEQFDWSVLEAYDGNTPFLLSGGIGPDDAQSVLSFKHPRFIGVDLNSRFESSPGVKDVHLLKAFCASLNKK